MASATGSFAATGSGAAFIPNTGSYNNGQQFNVAIYGTFVGTIVLEASFDSGSNWVPVLRYCTGTAVSYTRGAACA